MDRTRAERRALSAPMLFACSLAAAAAAGCGGGGDKAARPLTATDFALRQGVSVDGGRTVGQPIDQAGTIADVPYARQPTAPDVRVSDPPGTSADANKKPTTIAPAVAEAVGPRAEAAIPTLPPPGTNPPTTAPVAIDLTPSPGVGVAPGVAPSTSRPAGGGGGGGGFVPLGSVVMEVNSHPIYSHKVLQALERSLAKEARLNDERQFRAVAEQLIRQQVNLLKREELEVASAELALSPQDKSTAKALTMQWRQKQITAAGGSVELARRKAAEDGLDFEELARQQERRFLVQLFYSKQVYPNVVATPKAMREFYEAKKVSDFTVHSKAKFRLIKINPADKKFPDKAAAVAYAEQIKTRAADTDFAKLADEVNGDSNGGRVGTAKSDYWVNIDGSYRYPAVEKAVAALKPGQVTDIIQTDGLLLLAKLDALQEGKVMAFDDPAVQERISQAIRGQQVEARREQHINQLEQKAITVRKPGQMEELLEMVMRRYPEWSGKATRG